MCGGSRKRVVNDLCFQKGDRKEKKRKQKELI
jgi:hypothetical protein